MEEFKEALELYILERYGIDYTHKDSYSRNRYILRIFEDSYFCDKMSETVDVCVKPIEKDVDIDGGCYGVIKFGEKYFKAEWYQSSYDGSDPYGIENTIHEVIPVEKVITVYETKV